MCVCFVYIPPLLVCFPQQQKRLEHLYLQRNEMMLLPDSAVALKQLKILGSLSLAFVFPNNSLTKSPCSPL